ncbi:hypothetical protein OKW43_003729 [Paraburkholderia sp. WC7.3g]|uniref:hypothetical protein n=1 Tax=Paraburkholderia sp. WC7.3g TaxID=2991070 RepID=UPI003D25C602
MTASHISERNKQIARANITAKLEILETWSRTGIPWLRDADGNEARDSDGEQLLDYFPPRPIDFASWNGTQNCQTTHKLFPELSSIKATRRSTLSEPYHSDIQSRVQAVLEVLRAKGHEQLLLTNKTSRIETLQAGADYWQTLAHKQEGDIIALRERMSETEVKLRAATLALENNRTEAQRVIDNLNAKVANLTGLLAKVAPLK